LAEPRSVVRLPPSVDPTLVAVAVAARGNTLVLCPTASQAHAIARGLRTAGVPAAQHPRDWALGAAGATVVGTRAAAWAPVGDLAAVVVVDEHDESHQQEQAPTWHARDVAAERARRAGVPCVLTSPCPTLEAQRWGRVVAPRGPCPAPGAAGPASRASSPRRGRRWRPSAGAGAAPRAGPTGARAGRSSTWSTCATRTRAPGCCRPPSSGCCAATAGSCACST